jgi:hypothetical protein
MFSLISPPCASIHGWRSPTPKHRLADRYRCVPWCVGPWIASLSNHPPSKVSIHRVFAINAMSAFSLPEPTVHGARYSDSWADAGHVPNRFLHARRFRAGMEGIRAKVLAEFCAVFEQNEHLIKLAIDEAEMLACQTGYPELFFPELASERARKVAASLAKSKVVPQY